MAPEIDITITRGKTFEFGYLYADDELVYKPITAMPSTAPVRLTVAGHGVPEGWPVQVKCVKAPTELNSAEGEYQFAKVVDANTLELNALNAHCWKSFSGSGLVVYSKPAALTGWKVRAKIRDKVGGTVLFTWASDPAESPSAGGSAVVDVALSAFVLGMTAATAAAITWTKGVYEVEAIDPAGAVYPVTAISAVTVASEVTA